MKYSRKRVNSGIARILSAQLGTPCEACSALGTLVTTWSIRPYARASSALMNRSRSIEVSVRAADRKNALRYVRNRLVHEFRNFGVFDNLQIRN